MFVSQQRLLTAISYPQLTYEIHPHLVLSFIASLVPGPPNSPIGNMSGSQKTCTLNEQINEHTQPLLVLMGESVWEEIMKK